MISIILNQIEIRLYSKIVQSSWTYKLQFKAWNVYLYIPVPYWRRLEVILRVKWIS